MILCSFIFYATIIMTSMTHLGAQQASTTPPSRQVESSELIDYLHKFKLAYNRDWNETTFNNALNSTFKHIQTLSEEEAAKLFETVKTDWYHASHSRGFYNRGTFVSVPLAIFFALTTAFWATIVRNKDAVSKYDADLRKGCLGTHALFAVILLGVSVLMFMTEGESKITDLYPGKSFFDSPDEYYLPLLEKLMDQGKLPSDALSPTGAYLP